MSQTIQVKRGNKTNLPILAPGELGLCVDSKEVYIGNGATNAFVGRAMTGTYALRPNSSADGRFYYVNSGVNQGYLYIDDGVAWHRINALTLSDLSGNIDNIADGSTYMRVKASEILNGQVKQISDGTNTVTAATATNHINDATKHRQINDAGTGVTDLWSAQNIKNQIELAKHNIEPQASVKDQHLLIPPVSPASGDRYIIAAGTATGAWVGKNTQITEWNGSSWDFYIPSMGWNLFVDDELKMYGWSGSAWVRTGGALQTVTAGSGLTGGGQADTVMLNIGAGNGISVGADSISVIPYKGITVDGNGVSANIDGYSIIYDITNGNKLSVATVDGGTF